MIAQRLAAKRPGAVAHWPRRARVTGGREGRHAQLASLQPVWPPLNGQATCKLAVATKLPRLGWSEGIVRHANVGRGAGTREMQDWPSTRGDRARRLESGPDWLHRLMPPDITLPLPGDSPWSFSDIILPDLTAQTTDFDIEFRGCANCYCVWRLGNFEAPSHLHRRRRDRRGPVIRERSYCAQPPRETPSVKQCGDSKRRPFSGRRTRRPRNPTGSHTTHNASINTRCHRQRGGGIRPHRHHISGVERQQPGHEQHIPLWHAMDVSM